MLNVFVGQTYTDKKNSDQLNEEREPLKDNMR